MALVGAATKLNFNEILANMHSDWMPLSWAFKGDVSEWVKMVWPNLYVHRTRSNNRPSRTDPLGAIPAIQLVWDSGAQTAGVIVFDEASPLLEPGTLKNYMLIQWPELFRTFENGTQP